LNSPLRIAVALNLAEPYAQHQDVFLGIRRYAREQPHWRYVVDECPAYSQQRRAELFQHYDGVIARASPTLQRRLRRQGVPLVNTWYQQARRELPGVYQDPYQLGELAAEHLIERGFRRLSLLSGDQHKAALDAAVGLERYCEQAEAAFSVRRIPHLEFDTERDWLETERCLTTWLDGLTPPVGVCLEEAALARLLINLCEARGWSVPVDVAIVSFNDNRMIAELPPQITCIHHGFERVGYEAAALLDRLIAGDPPPEESVFVPPKGVVARQSTDHFAVEDAVVAAALRYISGHLAEKLTVADIAREVSVSPRSLQLRFSAALGRPISDEIRRLRVTAAQRLLADPDRRINDIARQTGLGTGIAMSHLFRREQGMSPKAYREQLLGKRGA
jgi:LacI family transcriptional regulator